MKAPNINIPSELWTAIVEAARSARDDIIAFQLFCQRGRRRDEDYEIKDIKPVRLTVEQIRVGHNEMRKVRFHKLDMPTTTSPVRYCGSAVVRPDIELGLDDAYWIGWTKVDLRVLLRMGESGDVEKRAFWTHRDLTGGHFVEIPLVIV